MDVKKKVLLAIIAYSLFPNASLSALTSDINQSKVTSQKVKTHLKRNQNSSFTFAPGNKFKRIG